MSKQNALDSFHTSWQKMHGSCVPELQRFVRMINFASTDSEVIENKLLRFTLMIPRGNLEALARFVRICRREVDRKILRKGDISSEVRDALASAYHMIANELRCVEARKVADISHKLAIADELQALAGYIPGIYGEVPGLVESIASDADRLTPALNWQGMKPDSACKTGLDYGNPMAS